MIVIPSKIKWYVAAATLSLTLHSCTPKLHTDATPVAVEKPNPVVMKPDSSSIAVKADSIFNLPGGADAMIDMSLIPVYSHSGYSQMNYSWFVATLPISSYACGSCVNVYISATVFVPPKTECALGLIAAAPSAPVKISSGLSISTAAVEFTAMVPGFQFPVSKAEFTSGNRERETGNC